MAIKLLLLSMLTLVHRSALGQSDINKRFHYGAYGEIYYGQDFPSFNNKERAPFLYNHKQTGTIALNLLMVSGQYTGKRTRANLGLMTGTYTQYNLADEPIVAQNIYEANVGWQVSKKKNLWLDLGVFPSHLGFESVLSKECYTLTRSIVAENSPYYESGMKLSFSSDNQQWMASVLLLNGWQKIRLDPQQLSPAVGLQLSHQKNERFSINYSNYLGQSPKYTTPRLSSYHNIYLRYNIDSTLRLCLGFDVGTDYALQRQRYGIWYTPVCIVQSYLNSKLAVAARAEYFKDPHNIILDVPVQAPDQASAFWGFSTNADYRLRANILLRGEVKYLQADAPYFGSRKHQLSCTGCICFWL